MGCGTLPLAGWQALVPRPARRRKLENIARDDRVSFTVWEFGGILTEGAENPCLADAAYECAVLRGKARLVEDPQEKRRRLLAITEKYAPSLRELPIPEERIAGTALVEVTPIALTGKYHR